MTRRPPISTLFPSTPLSRPRAPGDIGAQNARVDRDLAAVCRAGIARERPPVVEGALPLRALRREGPALEPRERDLRAGRSEEHTSELQSPCNLVCRLLLEKK